MCTSPVMLVAIILSHCVDVRLVGGLEAEREACVVDEHVDLAPALGAGCRAGRRRPPRR